MSAKLSFECVSHLLMIEEPEPTPEALARWQEMYPHYRDDLAQFFDVWARFPDPGPEDAMPIDDPEEDAAVAKGVAYAMDVLRKQGRLVPQDYVATILPFDQLILSAVIELQGLGYNGNIARLAGEISGQRVLMGTALASLLRLERLKLVVWRYADPVTEPQNDGRQYFMATMAGERSLAHAKAAARRVALGDFA